MFTRAPRKKLFHKGEKCFRPASFGLAQKINSEIPARFHYSVFFSNQQRDILPGVAEVVYQLPAGKPPMKSFDEQTI